MVNFIHHFTHPQFISDYRSTQFTDRTPFEAFGMNDVLIGTIKKGVDGWEQKSGRQMMQEIVDAFGKQIDDNGLWT